MTHYRKRGSASNIVREVRSVRERERERERERDGSDVTLVALKLAMNVAPFLAKNLHLSIGDMARRLCQNYCPTDMDMDKILSMSTSTRCSPVVPKLLHHPCGYG